MSLVHEVVNFNCQHDTTRITRKNFNDELKKTGRPVHMLWGTVLLIDVERPIPCGWYHSLGRGS